MNTNALVIDLARYPGPVYSGRATGEALREHLHLDAADAEGQHIELRIPAGTYTVSSGFFLGLLGPSIRAAGSQESFDKRVAIDAPEFLQESLQNYVRAALAPRL